MSIKFKDVPVPDEKQVLTLRMPPALMDHIDTSLTQVGDDYNLFPGGEPCRSEFVRKAIVLGIGEMLKERKKGRSR